MFRRTFTAVLAVAAAGSLALVLAGSAAADTTCTSSLLCAGDVVHVHDVTTTATDVLNGLHLLGS